MMPGRVLGGGYDPVFGSCTDDAYYRIFYEAGAVQNVTVITVPEFWIGIQEEQPVALVKLLYFSGKSATTTSK